MKIENTWIRFEENGERITGRKGRVRKNRNDKLYFEIHDVMGEDTLRININDYLSNVIAHTDSEYVTILCKDAERNFVYITEADADGIDVAPHVAFDEVTSYLQKKELILSIARVIQLYDNIEYRDEEILEMLSGLQRNLEEKLGVDDAN